MRKRDFKFLATKNLFRLFKTIERNYLINDSHNGLHITNPICHNRTIVTIVGALQKGDSIMNAINEINRKGKVNEVFLFCKSIITSGWNAFYLQLLTGLILSKK